MDLQLSGKTALILGGSKGIGRGIADALAAEGVAVAMLARNREVLDRAVAHGDEHVIKFTDTAAEVHARTGQTDALAAALRAGTLIPSPRD